MYDVLSYGSMIADTGRIEAYARALERLVAPGSVVLDLGTGSGIMALLACRAGASKVYAVEPSDVIQLAREIAVANGYGDRIEFVQALSANLELPRRVDGIVSDVRGTLPLFQNSLVTLMDARNRLLTPEGWIVAGLDSLWAALVSSAELEARFCTAWQTGVGFDFAPASARATNHWCRATIQADDLAVEPRCWATLDYKRVQTPNVRGEACWVAASRAVIHGVAVWFDTETAQGIELSNSPSSERHIYTQAFFPWPKATEIAGGDDVRIRLRADFVRDEYVWSWEARISDGRSGRLKTEYRQSSFGAFPMSPDRLRRRAHEFVPGLNEDARVDRRVLELMDEHLTLGEIGRRLLEEFPGRFKDWHAALTRAADLSERYS